MITEVEKRAIIKRLLNNAHRLYQTGSFHYYCLSYKKEFRCPADMMDSIGIMEWWDDISKETCKAG